MTAALAVTALLVFVMGVAIQRGNTCTVVAFDDLVHRRSWHRIEAIVLERWEPLARSAHGRSVQI